LTDFKDSSSERFIARSSAERQAWVQCIEQASSERLNLLIRQLKEQIQAQSRQTNVAGTSSTMGNHIDLGMPLEQQVQEQLQLHSAPAEESTAAPTEEAVPFEGDLIQF